MRLKTTVARDIAYVPSPVAPPADTPVSSLKAAPQPSAPGVVTLPAVQVREMSNRAAREMEEIAAQHRRLDSGALHKSNLTKKIRVEALFPLELEKDPAGEPRVVFRLLRFSW